MKKGALTGRFVLLLFLLVLLWTGCAESELFGEGGAGETASLEAALENPQTAVPKQEEADAQPSGETQASGESGEETVSFLWEGASFVSHFAFDSLTDAQKQWYRDIEKSLGAMEETVRLSQEGIEAGLDETCIDQIFQCVLIDHPELFYVEGYTYTKYERGGSLLAIDFSGTYSMDSQSALTRKEAIEAGAAVYLSGIAAESSEYEKVKYVYETLIRNTDYDLNSVDNQNIYSVFVNHLSVCQGYAKAAQYLLNRLGVECTLVMGTVDTGEGHAWNLVKVDGAIIMWTPPGETLPTGWRARRAWRMRICRISITTICALPPGSFCVPTPWEVWCPCRSAQLWRPTIMSGRERCLLPMTESR